MAERENIESIIESLNDINGRVKSLQVITRTFRREIERSEKPGNLGIEHAEELTGELAKLEDRLEDILERLPRIRYSEGESGSESYRPPEQQKPQPPPKTEDFAQHFRSVIETSQLQAVQGAQGEIGSVVKSIDVELKGLLVVEGNETRIVTPIPGRAIDAAQLSTIRMSFSAVPILRPSAQNQPQQNQPVPPVGTEPKQS